MPGHDPTIWSITNALYRKPLFFVKRATRPSIGGRTQRRRRPVKKSEVETQSVWISSLGEVESEIRSDGIGKPVHTGPRAWSGAHFAQT